MEHPKKLLRTLIVTGVLSSALFLTAAAADLGVGVVTASSLRMRAEANTEASVVTSLTEGTEVTVLEAVNEDWYYVSYQDYKGYMSSDYLKLSSEAADDTLYGRVSASSLNVRSSPSTDAEKLGSLSHGTVVTIVTPEVDGWYEISYQDGTAYVSADYLVSGIDPNEVTIGQQVVDTAMTYLGTPYVYGASGPNSFDCSGFTSYIYKQFGYTLNRSAADQTKNGVAVDKSELQPGDLVLFRSPGSSRAATHVGIYIGNSQFVHAPQPGDVVKVSDLNSSWYSRVYVGARRIV